MRLITSFNRALAEWGSVAAYSAVFVITVYDVMLRYFFHRPTVWGLELVIAIAAVHYVVGGAGAQATNQHVRIDAIYNTLPPRVQRMMDILADLLALGFLGVVTWYGVKQAWPAILSGETSGGGWNSYAPTVMKTAIPVGAALMVIQTLGNLATSVRRARNEW